MSNSSRNLNLLTANTDKTIFHRRGWRRHTASVSLGHDWGHL